MGQAIQCPKCDSDDLLVVRLSANDQPMIFHTCRHCENRWWEQADNGADLSLDTVIEELTS